MGTLESVPIEFQVACDVTRGGVLLALPALLAVGLLRYSSQLYQLPRRILWPRQYLSAAGVDGAGAHPVSGTTAL